MSSDKNFPFNGAFSGEFIAGFSRRSHGNMSLNYGRTREALDNRRSFLSELGLEPEKLVCAKQVHKARVKRAGSGDKGRGALVYDTAFSDTDAIITSETRLPLAVFTADCLSVFLYDPVNSAAGLAHAGWRSTFEKISVKTVEAMSEAFGSRPADIRAGFGPCIGDCCYEVSGDFREKFPGHVEERGRKFFLDLAGVNREQLAGCGIPEANISALRVQERSECTYCCGSCGNEFFSFRREGDSCGRMMSVMMLL